MNALDVVTMNLKQSQQALAQLLASPDTLANIAAAAQLIGQSIADGGRVFSCGNGGSMCDAMHFAEELSGRYRDDRKACEEKCDHLTGSKKNACESDYYSDKNRTEAPKPEKKPK